MSFRKISAAAWALLVPYWLWVGYATALNFAIWWMNR
ncbi:MAG: tryptophan-rich sensory protein [Acidobacteriota bacterium]